MGHTLTPSFLFPIIIYHSKFIHCYLRKGKMSPKRGRKRPELKKSPARWFLTSLEAHFCINVLNEQERVIIIVLYVKNNILKKEKQIFFHSPDP